MLCFTFNFWNDRENGIVIVHGETREAAEKALLNNAQVASNNYRISHLSTSRLDFPFWLRADVEIVPFVHYAPAICDKPAEEPKLVEEKHRLLINVPTHRIYREKDPLREQEAYEIIIYGIQTLCNKHNGHHTGTFLGGDRRELCYTFCDPEERFRASDELEKWLSTNFFEDFSLVSTGFDLKERA